MLKEAADESTHQMARDRQRTQSTDKHSSNVIGTGNYGGITWQRVERNQNSSIFSSASTSLFVPLLVKHYININAWEANIH